MVVKFLALLVYAPIFCSAAVHVAFIELKKSDGTIVQLERDGRFAHIAISYQDGWLHTHPKRGVEFVSTEDLEKFGAIRTIVTLIDQAALEHSQIEKYLGKPYDRSFSWSDDRLYCSELVAKLLNMEPKPMIFDASLWPKSFSKLKNKMGLSPDDIFKTLKKQGYPEIPLTSRCSRV